MKNVRKNQIILIAIVLTAIGCMTHVSIKYNRAVERLEQQTVRTESLKSAYIRYLERKANIDHSDSLPAIYSQELCE